MKAKYTKWIKEKVFSNLNTEDLLFTSIPEATRGLTNKELVNTLNITNENFKTQQRKVKEWVNRKLEDSLSNVLKEFESIDPRYRTRIRVSKECATRTHTHQNEH